MPTTSFDLHSILMQVREGTLYSHFTDKLSSGIAGLGASHVAQVVKNPPANAGDTRDMSSIPRSGRSPGGGHVNPLQYSCLANSHGQRSLVGYSSWGCKELDMTKWLRTAQHSSWEGTLGTGEITKYTLHFLVETYRSWVFMSHVL